MLAHDRFIHKDDKDSSVDITWYHPSGFVMQKEQWHCHHASTLGYLITEKSVNRLPSDTTASNGEHEGRKIPAERKITMTPFSTIVLLNNCL
jgi:glycogen operon protein